MKKLIALLLSVIMLFSMMACSTGTETEAEVTEEGSTSATGNSGFLYSDSSEYKGELPLTTNGETITIGIRTSANVLDYETNEYTTWLEEQTGINIEFVPFAGSNSDAGKQISLMVAAGEKLPDILYTFGGISKKTGKGYGQDGIFVDMRDYYKKYAYYMNEAINRYFPEESERNAFIDEMHTTIVDPKDGALYFFANFDSGMPTRLVQRAWINQQWLDKLGLEAPATVEELYDVLVAFRDNDPNGNGKQDEIPMAGTTIYELSPLNYVTNAYIYNQDNAKFSVENDHVFACYDQPEYRQAMIMLNKMVKEGLLTPLTFTQSYVEYDSMIQKYEGVYRCGVIFGNADEEFDMESDMLDVYVPLAHLKDATGRGGYAPLYDYKYYYNTSITADCENPELAFKLLDFMCSEESVLRAQYGVFGRDWEYYTDDTGNSGIYGGEARLKVYDWNVHTGINNICWHTAIGAQDSSYWQPVLDDSVQPNYAKNFRAFQTQLAMAEESGQPEQVLYAFLRTEEEDEAWNEVNTDITNQFKSERDQLCSGVLDPNSDTDWNAYVDGLNAMGYSDPWISIPQAAWNRMHNITE